MGRRLRIAFIVHEYNRYMGHSRYVAELATRFRDHHDVHVFSNRVDVEDRAGITFHHVPAWRRNALATIVSFILPATFAVQGTFDIVHAQGLCGLRQNVITAHICQPAWFAAGDRYAGPVPFRKRVSRAVVGRLDRLAMRHRAAKAFLAPSNRVKADLNEWYGLGERIRVVYHGTDTETFHPRNRETYRGRVRSELGLRSSDFVALYVGDLQKAIVPAIMATGRTPGVWLVAVSRSNPDPYRGVVADVGAADRVIFVPTSKQVHRYFAAADCFLFPTYYDAFGLVVTEAMATGLPVITSQAAGAAELIFDGVNGLLTAEPWNVPALAHRLAQLRDDPRLRARLGAAARATVEAYTWDRTAAETLAVYHAIVSAGK